MITNEYLTKLQKSRIFLPPKRKINQILNMKKYYKTWMSNSKKNLKVSLIFMFFNCQIILSQTFPAGFSRVKVASLINGSAMCFAPDGRLFVCQKEGIVRIIKNGTLLTTPFLTLTVDINGERGISGITFDPDFDINHYVYIYYTATTPSIHNRLSRFTANGDLVLSGSEFPLLDAEPVASVFHDGGGMGFAPDGKLYLSMGEDNKPSNAQDPTTYKGKLLRLNSNGTAPADNPYITSTSQITKKIWASGLRNPYTLAIQPVTGKIFVNNVGADSWEEVNDATSPGKNFGWPVVEGKSSNTAYTNPVFAYPHDATGQNGCAITGGAFFNPTASNYPSTYIGKYFYMDYCKGWMYYLTLGTTVSNTFFSSGMVTKNLALQVGPDGNLYYINRDDTNAGVYKIIYSLNNSPVITNQPDNVTIAAGQQAIFTVSASGSTPFTYQWKKNGTDIAGATSLTYTINNVQQSDAGQYSVIVTNSYGNAASNAAILSVTAFNTPPDAYILTPTNGTYFHAGDTIYFSGSATDTEDGTLAASSFEWTVEFHHNNNHSHPGPVIPSGIISGSFIIPNSGEPSANIFYRLKLKVTDSNGLMDTAHVDILPLTSTITINTQPAGLQVTFDSQPKTTPFSILTIEGLLISIGAVSPQSAGNGTYAFNYWQHGGNVSQTIKVEANDSSYIAIFKDTIMACNASGSITRDFWKNVTGTSISSVPINMPPTSTSQLSVFEGPSNVADNYGSRIRGYLCPPSTGNYFFYIASDNNSELWLSTNDQPANKIKIATVSSYTGSREWTKYSSQKSAPVGLIAGVKYYIEAIHRDGTRGDNIAVGWQLPNGNMERPISGIRLSPYIISGNNPPVVNITSPLNNSSFFSATTITVKADAISDGAGITKVEFFQGATKIGEDLTAPYSYTWMNVPLGNYTLKAIATDNNGQSSISPVVNIIVTTCSNAIITPSGPTTMCSGSVVLNATTGTGIIYQWKKDGADINGATNSSYTATTSGEYQIKIIQGSCILWSAPTSVKIETPLSASITPGGPLTFCSGGEVKLFANTCSGYTYQWKKDGSDISGATGPVYKAVSSGYYQVRVTKNGVNAWSSKITVTVNNCIVPTRGDNEETNIDQTPSESNDQLNIFQIKVYPNPNTGFFTIALNMSIIKQEKVKMRITNIVGQEIYTKEFFVNDDYLKENVELDGSLPTGIYTLQVMIGNKVENTTVVLSK